MTLLISSRGEPICIECIIKPPKFIKPNCTLVKNTPSFSKERLTFPSQASFLKGCLGLLAFEGSIRKEAGSKERNGRRIWQSPSLAVGIHNVFIRGLDLEHLTTQQEFERVKTYLSGQGIAATSYSTSSALVSAILGVNKKSSNEKEAKTASYISGVLASDSLLLSVQILSQPSFWPKCLEYMEKTKTLMGFSWH